MKKLYLLVIMFGFYAFLNARSEEISVEENSVEEIPAEDKIAFSKLFQALKANDKLAIAKLVQYPVTRLHPLPLIKNEDQFLENYGDFFDDKTISELEKSKNDIWSNWQGTTIGSGLIWLNSGRIYSFNISTELQKKKSKEKLKEKLHPSAQNFDNILFECKTKKHFIRIQNSNKKIYYFSWKNEKDLSQKPEIVLTGNVDYQGTGENTLYTFKNENYIYQVSHLQNCVEECNSNLTIYNSKRTKVILRQICKNAPSNAFYISE